MQAQYYSDKSIAVYGDTKPWKNNLMNLGGRYNKNLGGQPGYIFSRDKEGELMQFLADAQAGQVQPAQERVKQIRKTTGQITGQVQQPYAGTDGLYYQVISYNVEYPVVNQEVIISFGDQNVEYVVKQIENTQLPVDSILIEPKGGQGLSRAIVAKGKWQIEGMQGDHKLIFQQIRQ